MSLFDTATSQGFRLSPQQRRTWSMADDIGAYRSQCVLLLEGELQTSALERSVRELVVRYEILRTTFERSPGLCLPVQLIGDVDRFDWRFVDLQGLDTGLTNALAGLAREELRRPFDLARGPTLHALLAGLAPHSHALLLTLPAMCGDAATLIVLAEEIRRSYAGQKPSLADGEVMQYADLAEWQNESLEAEGAEEGKSFWRRRKPAFPLPLPPLASREPSSPAGFQPERLKVRLPEGTAQGLVELAEKTGHPLSALLLTCWQALLGRLGAEGDTVVGVRFDGRQYGELRNAVGPLERLLPLSCRPQEDVHFLDLLQGVDAASREAGEWQELFAWGGVPAAHEFFPLAFELLELPAAAAVDHGLQISVVDLWTCTERFVLRLSCRHGPQGLTAGFDFDPAVLNREEVLLVAERFLTLIGAVVAAPDSRIGELDVLAAAEREALLGTGAELVPLSFMPAHRLVEMQAASTPDAVAVIFEGKTVTYGELDRSAARLACWLRNRGAGPESLVGLCLFRSPDMVVALLAVLKTGAAYVPLDPESPRSRLEQVIAGAEVKLVVTHEALLTLLPARVETLCLDREAAYLQTLPDEVPSSPADPAQLAYVVHTSGSTGRPKGVATSHGGVANYLRYLRETYGLGPADTVLQLAGLPFDASVRDILGPLGSGARIVVVSGSRAKSPVALLAALRENHVTCILSIVPTLFRALLDAAPDEIAVPLRLVLVSGEPLLSADCIRARQVFGAGVVVVNQYGPTECTMTTTWFPVAGPAGERAMVPAGRPIAGARVYLLNRRLVPVPAGAPGEVCIGGAGVTRGYLGVPGATAERFLPDPFSPSPGSRLYRTGDLGRLLPDGNLEFLGRTDHQVKVRGVRVEPAEVEAVLFQHPDVKQMVVVGREIRPGEMGLVAYYVPERQPGPQAGVLRSFAEASLPAAIVPAGFVRLDALPRTPNGKVDRKALPSWDAADASREGRYKPPRTPVEELLAEVFASVLGIEQVGVEDDFFALGGHSLMAARAVAQISAALQIELPLQSIFDASAVSALATVVERLRQGGTRSLFPPPAPVPRDGPLPLSYGQLRVWFLDQLRPGSPAWILPEAVRMMGDLDVAALERSLEHLVRRHEALRTSFPVVDGRPVPSIAPRLSLPLPLVDLRNLNDTRRDSEAVRVIREVGLRPFALASGPLIRILLVRLGHRDHAALFSLHHLVADGWSSGIFLQELVEVYDALVTGRSVALPELPLQYADFAVWQQSWLASEAMQEQLAYWQERLAGDPAILEFPADRARSQRQSVPPGSVTLLLSEDLTHALRAASRREGVTLFMTLFAGFCALLHRYTGQTDLRVGNPVSGRSRPELDRIVGYFVNNLVLRTDLSGEPSAAELLRGVRAATLGAYAHQDLPFARLVELLYQGRNAREAPPFQVIFAFQSFPKPKRLDVGLALEPMEVRGEEEIERDLALAFEENNGRLQGRLRYRSDLFDPPRMERLVAHLRQLLEVLAEPSERPITEVPLLTGAEGQEILAAPHVRSAAAVAPGVAKPAAKGGAERRKAERWQDLSSRGGKLSAAKQQLLRQMLEGSPSPNGAAPLAHAIPRRPPGVPLPLSFGQQRLWFLSRLEPASATYNVPAALRLRGALNRSTLEAALREIVRRHEVLRTTFEESAEGEAFQCVTLRPEVGLPVVDLRGLPEGVRGACARQLTVDAARRPFDLARGPLLRVMLVQTEAEEHRALLAMHHIVSDAWSARLLVAEIVPLYEAFLQGRPSPLPELAIQYGDFALWQRQSFTPEVLAEHLAYWRRQLESAPAVLALPADRPRPPVQTNRGATESLRLSPGLAARVAGLAQREGLTPFMGLLAAFQLLLARWSGQSDISVGMPASGRDRVEAEKLIGFFLNTLVIRTDLGDDPVLRALLARVKETVLGAQAHQAVPFERLVSELQPERSMSVSPLFQVMFSLQSQSGRGEAARLPGLEVARLAVESETANFDLTLSMGETRDGLVGSIEYSTDLFDRTTVARLAGYFGNLLESLLRSPEQRTTELVLLGEAERQQLLVEWNDSPDKALLAHERRLCLHELVRLQAGHSPETLAVEGEGVSLTYGELHRRARLWARTLREWGVGPESRVGLAVARSPELIVGMLAILEAGGAYLPLDPGYPPERLAMMLADSGAAVLVTEDRWLERLPANLGARVFLVEGRNGEKRETALPAAAAAAPESAAYVIYTSGSTGVPKGVVVEHRSAAAFACRASRLFGTRPGDRVLQFASINFDISVEEIFSTFAGGGTLVLRSDEATSSIAHFLRELARRSISVIDLPTAYWHELVTGLEEGLELPPSLRLVVIGGEEARLEKLAAWERRVGARVRLINSYGPTETTVVATYRELTDLEPGSEVSLGRPLPGARVYVAGPHLTLLPAGTAGELLVGGDCVARGYLGRPDLTAARFIPDPFSGDAGARLYRTGDLTRLRRDGELIFSGRLDRQIKVRGYRVELEEIEAVLSTHPGVQAAVVDVREDAGNRRLVAYVVPGAEPAEAGDLRDHLRRSLPDYMLPSSFVILQALPLTPSGKLDRRSLPAPTVTREAEAAAIWPRSPVEEIVGAVWAEVLGIPQVTSRQSFFDLGGHSLIATRVISRVRATLGVELPLRALFEAPTLGEFSLAVERSLRGDQGPQAPPLKPAPPTAEPLTLSFAQERLWFLEQLDPGRSTFNIPTTARLRGPLDVSALAAALGEVVRRHQVLRTTLRSVAGEPVQEVAPEAPVPLPVVDLSALAEPLRSSRALLVVRSESGRPFDLARGPLVRGLLIDLAPEDHVVILTLHHIVSDGWSMGILLGELARLYADLRSGGAPSLPDLPVQYADYARWQRLWLQGEVLEAELAHWRRRLEGAPQVLELPSDRPRPAVRSGRGAVMPLRWKAPLALALQGLSRRGGATLFMTVLAGLHALLSRYTGETDILVGSPIAGRNRLETEGLIGFFVNTLVLRGDLTGDPELRTLLGRVRETVLEAHAHQDLPFEKLVQELRPERSLSHTPLFQVSLVLQNTARAEMQSAELVLEPFGTGGDTAKVDLTLALAESPEGISGSLEYSTDLFDSATVARLAGHLERLLAGAVEAPGARVSRLPLLSAAERLQLLEWNDTDRDLPGGGLCLHQLFEAQARRTPEAVAVVDGPREVLYRELDEMAERLAGSLRRSGAGPEVVVGVCLERSSDMVAALLAILKAGAAYLPLNPMLPRPRLEALLTGARASLVVSDRTLAAGLPWNGPVVLPLEEHGLERGSGSEDAASADPENLAYVLFTSGSTGTPKGVAVTHRSAVELVRWAGTVFAPEELAGVLAATSLSFDLSVFELFVPLAWGGTVILARNVLELPDLVASGRVTLVNTVPSAMIELVSAGSLGASVRTVNLAGEPLHRALAEGIYATGTVERVWNLYGPTEDTTYSTFARMARESSSAPTIGRPITATQAHVTGFGLELVPVGVAGELNLGGAGLARGYLHRPDLTAERFVPDPFGEPGGRLYRTGDLARWTVTGELELMGRLDHQVKVRGFRIELGEIEAALAALPGVREAAVLAREDTPGDRRLVAYVVPGAEPIEAGALRDHLRGRLPDYMLPSAFVVLQTLPLTSSGKVDRRSLPAPAAPRGAEVVMDGELSPVEEIVGSVWAEVLGVPPVGLRQNFFDLGGHSLMAMRVVSRVRAALGVEMPLRALFEAPTLGGFSRAVERALRHGPGPQAPPIEPVPRTGDPLPLSFAQERLWFLEQLEPGLSTFNIPATARLRGPLEVPVLAAALSEVVRRHEVLRTTLRSVEGVPVQDAAPAAAVPLPVVDLSGLTEPVRSSQAYLLALSESGRPFDLSLGPLLRALLMVLAPREHVACLTLHHIVSDGWSMDILTSEISKLYAVLLSGGAVSLPELPIQYADYARWQRSWLQGEVLEAELAHWRRRLEGAPQVLELPADRPRPALRSGRGAVMPLRWGTPLAMALRSLSRREGITLFMTMLAGLQVLLGRYTGKTETLVGSPIAGRNRLETEGLIGVFVNTLVLRGDASDDPEVRTLLGRVRDTVLEAHAHQDLPFEKLVQELQPQRSLSHTPLFQVLLVLQNTAHVEMESAELVLEPFGTRGETAKFDLTVSLGESRNGLAGSIEYSTDLFDAATVVRLASHLERLLAAVAELPDGRISRLPLLSAAERLQLLEWNDTDRDPAGDGLCLHQLFEAQARRTPEAVAVVDGAREILYRELDEMAGRLAGSLRRGGAGPEAVVGVCLERSLDMVAALLAILKAGAAYLPLDPVLPRPRLEALLTGAGASLVVSDRTLASGLPWDGPVVLLGEEDGVESEPGSETPRLAAPENLAYVLFTSGSTGTPKGVAVTHRSAVELVRWAGTVYAPEELAGVLAATSLSFDLSVFELFVPLAWGGTVILARNVLALPDLVASGRVTLVNTVPSAMTELVLAGSLGPSVRTVNLAGEPLHRSLAERIYATGTVERVWNLYGPTEDTTYSTFAQVARESSSAPAIGRPVTATKAYVLGFGPDLVPLGVAGELHLGGAGLARGYLHRPDLTAERFVPDPLAGEPGARLYRTGDLARWTAAGELELLGRLDHQVKIRGFRIELGEIEAALAALPGVREAAVVVREDTAGDRRLVAFVAANGDSAPAGELRRQLASTLPEYMVPAAFVSLESMPLTSSGKVDRRALLTMGFDSEPRTVLAPRDLLELRLARVWEELLGLQEVGVRTSFFELGGHSLLAMRLVARIRRDFGQELPVAALFGNPTVEGLANLLRKRVAVAQRPALVEIRGGRGDRPFFCVHPIGGNVLCYLDLARELGPEQPFYGLQTPDRAERKEPWSLPAMAACYLEAMRTVQPAGPYRLGGWSLGGVVVFEMVRQLRNGGEEVELAALIDPPAPRRRAGPKQEPLVPFAMDLGALLGLSQVAVRDFVAGLGSLEEILAALQKAGLADLLPPDLGLAELEDLFDLYGANHRALRGYKPEACPGPFLVIVAEGGKKRAGQWARLALGGADLHEIAGDHYSILRTEGAREMTLHLTEALRREKKR
jgi:amino acid adenylation domain-containing protein